MWSSKLVCYVLNIEKLASMLSKQAYGFPTEEYAQLIMEAMSCAPQLMLT